MFNARLVGSYILARFTDHGGYQTFNSTDWPWRYMQISYQILKTMRRINLQCVFHGCHCINFHVSPNAFDCVLPSGWCCQPSGALSDFMSRPFVVLSGLVHFSWKLILVLSYCAWLNLQWFVAFEKYTFPGKRPQKSTMPSFHFARYHFLPSRTW